MTKYTVKYHLEQFEGISAALQGYTKNCVISFLDLYQKVKRNFPEVKMVSKEQRKYLGERMTRIATEHKMILRPCGEGTELAAFGADCNGCMTQQIYENAIHMSLDMPKKQFLRKECACYLGNDIGAYNSCPHMCKYCYANYDEKSVRLYRVSGFLRRKNRSAHAGNLPDCNQAAGTSVGGEYCCAVIDKIVKIEYNNIS